MEEEQEGRGWGGGGSGKDELVGCGSKVWLRRRVGWRAGLGLRVVGVREV